MVKTGFQNILFYATSLTLDQIRNKTNTFFIYVI